VTRIVAINWKDIDDVMDLVPTSTLLSKWLSHDGTCGITDLIAFFETFSDQGHRFWDFFPNSQEHLGNKLEKRGKSILQSGISIRYQAFCHIPAKILTQTAVIYSLMSL
jgi:hypothetical protein